MNSADTRQAEYTAAELHALLSHPDGMVRSLADWTREYRGFGTRGLRGDQYSVDATRMERKLVERLEALRARATEPDPRICGQCAEEAYR